MLKNKGFTLVELLVVILIIAILVGIALPHFRGIQDAANTSKSKAELRVLATGIESYYNNQSPRAYPGTTTGICTDDLNGQSPLIVAEVLLDPFDTDGDEYDYIRNGNYYVVFSTGLNGTPDITSVSATNGTLSSTTTDDVYFSNGVNGAN